LLKKFQEEFAKYEKQRQELSNAEKLFDLPITTYSDLIEVDKDLKNMTKVYDLYEAQSVRLFMCRNRIFCYLELLFRWLVKSGLGLCGPT